MRSIEIEKIDEIYIRIKCDQGQGMELSEAFSFFVPNYRFLPKFKNKTWDGKIRLFHRGKRRIYKGLHQKVIEWAKLSGYKVNGYFPKVSKVDVELIKKIYRINDGIFEPRDSQIIALKRILENRSCVILSPTASGKSYFIYNSILAFQRQFKKGLLVVPRLNLISQMASDFHDYSENNGWSVEDNAHLIYSGQEKATNHPLYISTWQSLQNMPPEYFEQFDYLIVDEVHGAKAKELTTIVESCINAKYKIGTTGTLTGEYSNDLVIEGLFGPIFEVEKTSDMIEKGDASPLDINTVIIEYANNETNKLILKKKYHDQTQYLIENKKRNRFICKLVNVNKGNKLVLFRLKDHGKRLYEMYKTIYGDDKIFYIDGDIDIKKREAIRKYVNEHDDCVLFASYGTYAEGMNLPRLHHVFSTNPGKARVKTLQSIGRGLRLHESKDKVIFWDFADHIQYKKKKSFSLLHFLKRLQIYNEQRFKIKPKKVRWETY